MNSKIYRLLEYGDVIRVGDEWYEPRLGIDGTWHVITEKSPSVGSFYLPDRMRKIRRARES